MIGWFEGSALSDGSFGREFFFDFAGIFLEQEVEVYVLCRNLELER